MLVVGVGSIGQKEVRELKNHPQISVVGVVETDDKRRAAISPLVPKTYTDFSEGITDSNPDLVRIATPPQTHYKLAKTALYAGKDVYIEKIMTLRSEEARDLTRLAKKLGRSVYVRRNAIYTAVYKHAWDKLNEIGKIRHVHWIEPIEKYSYWSEYKQKWLHDLPGGIISEHLPHALYTVRWFLGEEPEVENVLYTGKELHVSLKCDEKRAEISYITPSDIPMLLNIVGSKGTLLVNHSTYRIIRPRGFEYSKTLESRTIRANIHDLSGSIKNFFGLVGHYFIRELRLNPKSIFSKSDNYRQFSDIAQGGNPGGDFRIDGEEGVKNVELFEKIWQKAGEIS